MHNYKNGELNHKLYFKVNFSIFVPVCDRRLEVERSHLEEGNLRRRVRVEGQPGMSLDRKSFNGKALPSKGVLSLDLKF
jgi:hypothetical protein